MSQKIVITANVNRNSGTAVPEVTYQWHWRRIVTVALLVSLALMVFAYSLLGSVNAEQNEASNDEQAQLSTAFDSSDTQLETTDEAIITQHDITNVTALDEVKEPITAMDEELAIPAPELVIDQVDEQELQTQKEDVLATEVSSAEQKRDDAKQGTSIETFAASAHIASVALGAKIDTDKVSRAVLTRDVVEREPINVFKADIRLSDFSDSLAFFSELKNLQGQRIRHIWRFENQVMASIELNVTSPRYRTYSNKHILPEQIGHWRVDVVDEQDQLLAQKEFRILAD
ncbi:DUF2914 domain-containing protein [Pseudoalteromonas shioyasakiensis]|uniref:DUF2914 domain-containing protein n=1 Tax=Pseudoalteromonas shioyasakiensis TaxID=1190813 RepID=UPI0021196F20|nr:DUF2914 domain-containing protein [Pseudoalteromonas shioyasakiensis]MCQ8879611.1 DUF2914 domain-containing protein [Pseudoalteromonas shioyasakiensis]